MGTYVVQTITENLEQRRLNTDLHKVWISEQERVATFPLYNLSGQLVGYQRYRPDATKEAKNDPRNGRYFTRIKDSRVGVWGIESWYLSDTLFITEGIFDAAAITYNGYSAVAVLSSDLSNTSKNWFWTLRHYRKVVAICDNDAAGIKLAKHANIYHIVKQHKDLGEASNDYVTDLVRKYEK